jgi:hypothetical protein
MSDIPIPAGSLPVAIEVEEENKRSLLSWVASVDHKQIAIMYLLTTLFFFGLGGSVP